MNCLSVDELKKIFFDYFKNDCGYEIIKGSSLVPTTDDSVLFTPAGMHPLIPYLTGKYKHVSGEKLVNIQNVVRTGAINRVGEDSFLTFFELFGAWTMGEYDKKIVLQKVWKFLTNEKYLNIPKERIYMTYFGGNDLLSEDSNTLSTWKEIGVKDNHLVATPKNFKGPYSQEHMCGPNTRIFYDTGKEKCSEECNALCGCGKYVELWDIVFFDYLMKDNKLEKHIYPCIDMGAGVERLAMLIQNVKTIYETDKLNEIVNIVLSQIKDLNEIDDLIKKVRIIADHLRCSCFILGDEIDTIPSSKGRGYVLRKIMRRTINLADQLDISLDSLVLIINKIIDLYKESNPLLASKKDFIIKGHAQEYKVYKDNLKKNLIKIKKVIDSKEYITSEEIYNLFNTYGVPTYLIKNMIDKDKIIERSK